ncbi:hypothetical protein [Streptomyces sp. NPDC002779]|uniref:hypothetical protein n=1 Tax=Streptomyces sp. NPDC002779 TaxID=3364664 RepID=UPI00369BA4D0
MTERAGISSRAQIGFGLAIAIGAGAAAVALVLLVLGLWKSFARATAPTLVDLPGGSWMAGGVLGVVSVLGAFGGLWCITAAPSRTGLQRALLSLAAGVCCLAAIGPLFYFISTLPGKNCHSSGPKCAYIPGTGSALLAYAMSVALVAWIVLRTLSVLEEAHAARERTRMRNLRKRGRKSRAARERARR